MIKSGGPLLLVSYRRSKALKWGETNVMIKNTGIRLAASGRDLCELEGDLGLSEWNLDNPERRTTSARGTLVSFLGDF